MREHTILTLRKQLEEERDRIMAPWRYDPGLELLSALVKMEKLPPILLDDSSREIIGFFRKYMEVWLRGENRLTTRDYERASRQFSNEAEAVIHGDVEWTSLPRVLRVVLHKHITTLAIWCARKAKM